MSTTSKLTLAVAFIGGFALAFRAGRRNGFEYGSQFHEEIVKARARFENGNHPDPLTAMQRISPEHGRFADPPPLD